MKTFLINRLRYYANTKMYKEFKLKKNYKGIFFTFVKKSWNFDESLEIPLSRPPDCSSRVEEGDLAIDWGNITSSAEDRPPSQILLLLRFKLNSSSSASQFSRWFSVSSGNLLYLPGEVLAPLLGEKSILNPPLLLLWEESSPLMLLGNSFGEDPLVGERCISRSILNCLLFSLPLQSLQPLLFTARSSDYNYSINLVRNMNII